MKSTPGQRSSSDATTVGTTRWRRTGSRPRSPSVSPNRLSATTSSTSRLSRSASSATSARISRRVASSRPLSSRASTRAPPKIVVTGVRSSCDRTPMNVSLTASRWRCSVTSRRTRIVSPRRLTLGRAIDRICRHLDPAFGLGLRAEDDRPGVRAEPGCRPFRVVQRGKDPGVADLDDRPGTWRARPGWRGWSAHQRRTR